MVSTLKEARKLCLPIRREVRYYAIGKDGILYTLKHDWELEEFDRATMKKFASKQKRMR